MAGLEPRRAAIYVDFDNVFTALSTLNRTAALGFATEPRRWLQWLADGHDCGRSRRLLVRRCYLNPAGSTSPASGGASVKGDASQVPFSQFRGALVRDGFEVVDCPRFARLKNAADMVMALDIVDALAHPTRFDEFLILSGDADFMPLLHRLRAHDRRILLVMQDMAAGALRSAADAVISLGDFAKAAVLAPEPTGAALPHRPRPPSRPDAPQAEASGHALQREAASTSPEPRPASADPAAQQSAILAFIHRALAEADHPIHLPALGKRIHAEFGGSNRRGRFGKAGTLAKLIRETPDLALEDGPGGGWLYDPARHDRPSSAQPDMVEGRPSPL